MTDEEIIKALQCCAEPYNGCEGCPLYSNYPLCDCERYTIELINRQKAEIERLKECPKCIYEYRGEMVEYCIQGPCSKFKTVNKIKSEAVKEFAARLKCGVPQETGVIRCSDVDKLVKEMVGKEE